MNVYSQTLCVCLYTLYTYMRILALSYLVFLNFSYLRIRVVSYPYSTKCSGFLAPLSMLFLNFRVNFVAIWGILLITCPGRDIGFLYWLADESRCKRLLVSVGVIFMDEAVPHFFPCFCVFLCCILSLTTCFYLLLFVPFLKFKSVALDSDDLLYLKEQMEAEEDAERLLRRTEKRAFAAFKISFCTHCYR